jgi:hypothetical protein
MSDRDQPSIQGPPPAFTLSRGARTRGRGRLALGLAVLVGCAAALAIVRWSRGPVPSTEAPEHRSAGVVAQSSLNKVPTGPSSASDTRQPSSEPDVSVEAPLPTPARPAVRKPLSKPRVAARPTVIAQAALPPEVQPQAAATGAVREFYAALGHGDGAKAATVVAPEAREDGALSAQALTQYYSSLRVPLRVTKIDAINDDRVFVRYQFVTSDDRLCLGSATVDTTRRDGGTLISAIRTFDGC